MTLLLERGAVCPPLTPERDTTYQDCQDAPFKKFDYPEMHDAANECPHGSLPHDGIIHCQCWGAQKLPKKETHMTAPTTSSNGTGDTAALVEQAARDRAKVMHAVYTGPDEPSLAAVGAQFNLSGARVGQEFKRFDLPVRSRGGGAIATETKPETPAAPKPAPKAATAVSPFVDRMRSEAQAELDRIDAEIKRLQDERQAVEQFHQAL